MKLECWSVKGIGDRYTPPELHVQILTGKIYGHPDFEDGHKISTSAIAGIQGRVVTTKSGSEYELGSPDPHFIEWCRENGHYVPTEEEPLKS
jgi:hypothetical protein